MTASLFGLRGEDLSWMLALNNAAVPHLNALTAGELEHLLGSACLALGVGEKAAPLGFLLALLPEANYASRNFAWFRERYDRFLYIDRVVVDPEARGRGFGQDLYRAVETRAAAADVPVACEVNERPPNPGSLRFHEMRGFQAVGRREADNGARSVVLLLKEARASALGNQRD